MTLLDLGHWFLGFRMDAYHPLLLEVHQLWWGISSEKEFAEIKKFLISLLDFLMNQRLVDSYLI